MIKTFKVAEGHLISPGQALVLSAEGTVRPSTVNKEYTMQRNEMILATHKNLNPLLNDPILNPGGKDIALIRSSLETSDMVTKLMVASRHTLDKTNTFHEVRQIIPYVAISKLIDEVVHYAVYSRSEPTEERLKDGCSLGFGGHIDAADFEVDGDSTVNFYHTVMTSIRRELEEEFGIQYPHDCLYTTFIHDAPLLLISRLTEVDRLHVGIVFEVRVKSDFVERIEKGLNFVGWFTADQIKANETLKFETWSVALIEHGLNLLD
jgi:predicted NUDIX family phosphoesterase